MENDQRIRQNIVKQVLASNSKKNYEKHGFRYFLLVCGLVLGSSFFSCIFQEFQVVGSDV